MNIEALEDLAAHIETTQGDAVRASQILVGELTLLAERDHIVHLLRFLRDDQQCNFETLIDICLQRTGSSARRSTCTGSSFPTIRTCAAS